METMINQVSQNEQIMQIFRKVMPLLNKKHFAQFETELRKLVPTENSGVMIKAGGSFDDKTASIHLFLDEVMPTEKVADWHFDQIIPLWLAKVDEEGRNRMYKSLLLMENQEGNEYEISGTLAEFRDYMNDHYIHFVIKKK